MPTEIIILMLDNVHPDNVRHVLSLVLPPLRYLPESCQTLESIVSHLRQHGLANVEVVFDTVIKVGDSQVRAYPVHETRIDFYLETSFSYRELSSEGALRAGWHIIEWRAL